MILMACKGNAGRTGDPSAEVGLSSGMGQLGRGYTAIVRETRRLDSGVWWDGQRFIWSRCSPLLNLADERTVGPAHRAEPSFLMRK